MEKMEKTSLSVQNPEQMQVIPELIKQTLGPFFTAMTEMMRQNTEAFQQVSAAQAVMNDRMAALEKQIRLNTPVTRQQAKYLKAAIKEKATELLEKSSAVDGKGVQKLSLAIKKETLSFYGVSAVEEIPKHEYSVAMNTIATWNNLRTVRDVVKEVRVRLNESEE